VERSLPFRNKHVDHERIDQDAMSFRLSQKLNAKVKSGTLPALPLDECPFADWSAHLFVADRMQYIILSNTKSLYSTAMYGKGISDDSHFIERALSSIRAFMEADGQAFVYYRFIAPASATVQFAKALNRSVTGSMNDLINEAKSLLTTEEISPFDRGFRLNEILLSALALNKAASYGTPGDAFKDLVSGGRVE
jgi:hypothetical protein